MDMDRRRGARLNASFWISIKGVIEPAQMRRGDISISGICFEADQSIGTLGAIIPLQLATADKNHTLEVMARVVREVRYDDLLTGEVVAGIALEYLVETSHQRWEIEEFVRKVAKLQADKARNLRLNYNFRAHVDREDLTRENATVQAITLEGMQIQTDRPVKIGEMVHVQVQTADAKKVIRFTGEAIGIHKETTPDGNPRYSVEVRFVDINTDTEMVKRSEDSTYSVIGSSISDALDTLMIEASVPADPGDHLAMVRHLQGALNQIPLPSLLSFLEFERRTGQLTVVHDEKTAKLFLREGRVVDLQTDPPARSPLEGIAEMMDWSNGTFEIVFQSVDVEDRIGVSTTALLLELAQKKDEAARQKKGELPKKK